MLRTEYVIPLSFVSFFLLALSPSFAGDWPPLSSEQLEKIKAAVPGKALAKPIRERKLLVFSLGAEANHKATPLGKKALELMGQRTGAFEVTHSSDPSMLKAPNLVPFDALVFNNSNHMACLDDPEIQDGILSFVRGGKGFVGIHGAATNFVPKYRSDWPEGAEMLGGIFDGHPWHEKVTIEVEEPGHPINTAFKNDTFEIEDEIYQFTGPYSRDKVRVLLSVDKTKSDMSAEKRKKMRRRDLDFPVSWVKTYGKGRVFYCSLGHDFPVFWNPQVLEHYLYGIQFALGDLPVDTTPRSQPGPLRPRSEQTVINEDWGSLTWLAGKNIGNAEGLVLGRVTIKAGKSNPRHRHPKSEEVLYLLKGRLEHSLGDKTLTLSAGDTITIAPGVFHNAACIGTEDADMIVVYSEGIRRFEPE